MNRYRRLQNILYFYDYFRTCETKLMENKIQMKSFKDRLQHHTGYTNKKVDKLVEKWISLKNTGEKVSYRFKIKDKIDREWKKRERRCK